MAGDTANVWQDLEFRVDPDPFCTSFQISSINENARSKNPLKPKAHIKQIFIYIIPATSPKFLTSETTFLIIF